MSTVEVSPWNVTTITKQTTTVVKTGSGILGKVLIPTAVASATIKIYDGPAASGRVLLDTMAFTASPPVVPTVLDLNLFFGINLTVVTAGATMSVGIAFI